MGLLPPKWPRGDGDSSSELDLQIKKQVGKWKQSLAPTPCSIGCPGMMGVVPNLVCSSCRCLFHMKCVGLRTNITVKNYICLVSLKEKNLHLNIIFPQVCLTN